MSEFIETAKVLWPVVVGLLAVAIVVIGFARWVVFWHGREIAKLRQAPMRLMRPIYRDQRARER